jgi:hypothetical protein
VNAILGGNEAQEAQSGLGQIAAIIRDHVRE